jgi:small conductance mechanosensitive channel
MEQEAIEILHVYWTNFLLLLPKLFISLIIFFIFLLIALRTSRIIHNRMIKRLNDLLLAAFLSKIIKWSIIIIGFIFFMQIIGLAGIAGGMFAGAGVAAFIIGFAFKDIGENFLSGIILAFNRPFKIGDIIVSQSITGTVTSLDLRTTNVKTFDGHDIFIPNSYILNNPLTNYNADSLRRHEFIVGVDYSSDLKEAIGIIMELLKKNDEVLKIPEPDVLVNELADNSVNLVVRFWLDISQLERKWVIVKSDIIRETKEALVNAGIDIPFPIIQLQMHQPGNPVELNVNSIERK